MNRNTKLWSLRNKVKIEDTSKDRERSGEPGVTELFKKFGCLIKTRTEFLISMQVGDFNLK